jgi:electron transfer flavoprotein alpha subunit
MSVLVYIESEDGNFKKAAFEVASYAREIANLMQTKLTAVIVNAEETSELGNFGVDKVLRVSNDKLKNFNARAYAEVLRQAAKNEDSKVVVLGQSVNSKYLAPLLAVHLDAGYVSNVISLPENTSPFVVKTPVFSNKAFSFTTIKTDVKIIGLAKNSFALKEVSAEAATEDFEPVLAEEYFTTQVTNIDKAKNKMTIADAEIVVSGGRGLKGPENWGMLEELAKTLDAATACSKPVSDMGWRPHSEHVGQTGKPVASNLYIAIGISGAIQHLAGINASKTKVVINNDPEAPFFKAADYGVVGDAFEVVPRLNEKLKEFKAKNA